MLQPHKPRWDDWLISDEPRTRIVAANRHRRRHATKPAVAAPPSKVIFEPPVKVTRKPSLFTRAAQAVRRVLGGRA